MKNVYLIISDIHDHYCNVANRINYLQEIDQVREQIIILGKKYKAEADNVNLILLGDVFKGSYNEPDSAITVNNFWILLSQFFNKIYCVLGNHETSFYSSNPFFTLVQNIESEKVKKILNKNWTPKGLQNFFNVVDLVEDGDVLFHFNHYDTPISRAVVGKTNIALYHQDIVNQQLLDIMQTTYGTSIYQKQKVNFDNVDIFDNFAYNFFGHLHKVYGTFECDTKAGTTVLCYLASLGRPNVTEVSNDFLERNIPAVIVSDGKLTKVEDNKFNLMSREECVKEEVVEVQQKTYQHVKHRKELRSYVPGEDNPLDNIRNCMLLSEKEKTIFFDLVGSSTDRYSDFLFGKYREVIENDR